MQGPGVCIRKISGSVEVTSGSSGRSLQSQIFYVRTSQRVKRPNRGFQLPPCPGVLSASALRAGALALAPTCTGPRGRAHPAPSPVPAPLLGRRQGCLWPRFMLRIRLASQMPRKGGNRAAQEAGSMRSAKQEGGSTGGRCAAASSSKGPRKQPVGRPKNKPSAEPLVRPRSSRRRMPARQPACSGDPLSCPLSFVLSSLTSLFMQQAE